jgi:glycosyltransferase involved in cell wall biosynthesis
MEIGGYSKWHPFVWVMQYAENFAYQHADLVVSILPRTLAHMVSHGMDPAKFCYIPNGVMTSEWDNRTETHQHADLIKKLHAESRFVVGYVGGHAASNALDTLLEAAALAQTKEPRLAFVLVGGGAEKDRLMRKALSLKLTNAHFASAVPKREIPALLESMDVLFIGWQNNPLYRFGISPNKMMDYMMSGRPIVHAVRAGNDLVAESGSGISVMPDDIRAVVGALGEVLRMSESDRATMGAKGRDFVLKNHNYEALAQKFIDFAVG